MLRIMVSESSVDGVIAKLEGQLRGPWVDEVRTYCEQILENGHPLTLDVKDVTFLDRDAVTLLLKLTKRGIRLVNRTPFLTELLRSDASGQ